MTRAATAGDHEVARMLAPPSVIQGVILVGPDDAGDGIGVAPGNPTITVDAASTVGTLEIIGDQDYYQVTLVAGHSYEIGMFAFSGGPNLFPVQDAYIELYSAAGTLLGSADGGASTLINNVNSGFDAVLSFTATVSGTYYVNARAFDNDPTVGGATGESIGDYELYVAEVDPNDPNVYHPYYDASSPLYSIDWGTQVNKINQSARNPDGDEGIRDTGNAQGTPDYNVNDVAGLDVAALATAQGKDIAGKNVITIYFAQAGDVFTSIEDPTSPGLPPVLVAVGTEQFERDTVWTALGEFEKVADVVYLEVTSRDHADFFFATYAGTPGPGVSLLGSMSPPDYPDEGLAQFNSGDERWTESNLQQGGFSFVTLIHEFGHGHGLAHPHDNGGHSGVMNGVEPDGPVADYTTGDFDLNQGVFTMMSYEDGWQSSPYGNAETDVGYGYLGGLMAFDIAAIQDKYGVNEDTNAGNDTYVLKDENAAGTFFYSIWDVDGVDAITYSGTRDANIDLRAASLQYEYGGGGWVSYADGIYGGFTIANSVVIENASSGAGNDRLIGNAAANILTGGGGDDRYFIDGGDRVVEAAAGGFDRLLTTSSFTLEAGSAVEVLTTNDNLATTAINLTGNAIGQYLFGNAGANRLDGGGGGDVLLGFQGDDRYVVRSSADRVEEVAGGGNDRVLAAVNFTLHAGTQVELLTTVDNLATTAINLTGNNLSQHIYGNAGANTLAGGGGGDVLIGLEGDDIFRVGNVADRTVESAGGGFDRVLAGANFVLEAGSDLEMLTMADNLATTALNLTGNAIGQYLYGNAGSNRLDGKGGADVMSGLGGSDSFAFTSALGGGNVDRIVDFDSASDTILLDDAVFTGLAAGPLGAGAFVLGTAAQDANDRILYHAATGRLFFDADGTGSGAAVLFATLDNHAVVSAGDFAVI